MKINTTLIKQPCKRCGKTLTGLLRNIHEPLAFICDNCITDNEKLEIKMIIFNRTYRQSK